VSKEARVPGTANQASSSGPERWDWVDRTIWTERMLAALDNGVAGAKWFSLIDKVYRRRTLEASWQQVRSKRGAAGVDAVSIERFEANEQGYLSELEQALREGSYRPEAIRRVEIPKAGGGRRALGIPTVKDRIVQTAVKRVMEPIFESAFMPTSYGFRPGRGCKDALREVGHWLEEGYTHVVDADLRNYFDSIPHERLMERVRARISDGRLLGLLEGWLRQDVVQELERWTPTGGTPQGAVISPLLANLYLHGLDEHLARQGYHMVRYADDFVVLCATGEQAECARREVQAWVSANGLSLHPDKTHVGDCRVPGQGFDFLGYRFEAGRRQVRKKSLAALKARIRERTGRTRGESLARVIGELNPMLRGWFMYFQHAHRWTFPEVDKFVRRRLRALLRKRQKRPGAGHCRDDHQRWPNRFFATAGLFTLTNAHRLASQSRC
jgi:RNA-directed DNA polymerase